MKKLLAAFSILITSLSFAQGHGVCGTDEHVELLFQQNPEARSVVHEQMLRLKSSGPYATDRSLLTIPVVVHVVHDGGESNISYEQIVSGIDMLNEDYQKLNADTANIRNTATAPFEPVAANIGLEFKLAKLDPQGNCTNGVERRYSPGATFNAGNDVKDYNSGGLDAWPRDMYMNIWVVSTISSQSGGTTLGYAQFPYALMGAADTYGVVIRHDRMGSIGTATSGDRTLTHELGHCLGLWHTFQGGCTEQNLLNQNTNNCQDGGDYCCDTPPVSEAQWSCSDLDNCSNVSTNDFYGFNAHDQFENFMSYSPCQYMFSEDQKSSVIGNLTSISWMQDLVHPDNAVATGVNLPDVLCKAEFTSSNTLICAGGSVDFSDLSYSNVSGRDWTFSGGTPASSVDSAVTVTYNTPGVYDVSLTATDGSSNVSTTETAYITVLASPGSPMPYHEGFEFVSAIPDNDNWYVENDNVGQTWELFNGSSFSGDYCVKMNNHGEVDGSKDHLISEPLDLSTVDPSDNIVFDFECAYRKRGSSNAEKLLFFVSSDCGETWVLRKTIHCSSISDEVYPAPFEPGEEDWVHFEVSNINSAYFVENFRFKFEFTNDSGNNLYIDHINLHPGVMTSIDENRFDNLNVYPNPVTDVSTISMSVYDQSAYEITLENALGAKVLDIYDGEMIPGEQKVQFSMEDLPAGIYFVNVRSEDSQKTMKLIKR